MKKSNIIIIAILAIALIVGGIAIVNNNDNQVSPIGNTNENTTNVETPNENVFTAKIESLNTVEEMKTAIADIYKEVEMPLQSLETMEIDVNDEVMLGSYTGLASNKDIEAVVVSEPMMSSQAYSLVMVKVSEQGDLENRKKWMFENINTRKWICVEAEKVYVTSYEDTIFLVMSTEELAQPVYDVFKKAVGGKVGIELQRTTEI